MSGKRSQRKGAAGERELAAILQEHGYDCTRGGSLTFGEVADISGLPGIYIEVKRVEKLNVVEAMEQSIQDSERMRDGMPALFHRRNRKPWLVTMRLVDWLKLYRTARKTSLKLAQSATLNRRGTGENPATAPNIIRTKPEQNTG